MFFYKKNIFSFFFNCNSNDASSSTLDLHVMFPSPPLLVVPGCLPHIYICIYI